MIVLLFGRGIAATLVVTVIVTFFPAFITIAQGLATVPKASLDLLDIYGASRLQKLRMVSLPMSLPYVCAAARLVARAVAFVAVAVSVGFYQLVKLIEERLLRRYGTASGTA